MRGPNANLGRGRLAGNDDGTCGREMGRLFGGAVSSEVARDTGGGGTTANSGPADGAYRSSRLAISSAPSSSGASSRAFVSRSNRSTHGSGGATGSTVAQPPPRDIPETTAPWPICSSAPGAVERRRCSASTRSMACWRPAYEWRRSVVFVRACNPVSSSHEGSTNSSDGRSSSGRLISSQSASWTSGRRFKMRGRTPVDSPSNGSSIDRFSMLFASSVEGVELLLFMTGLRARDSPLGSSVAVSSSAFKNMSLRHPWYGQDGGQGP